MDLLKGGQGRGPESVERDGLIGMILLVIGVVIIFVCVVFGK